MFLSEGIKTEYRLSDRGWGHPATNGIVTRFLDNVFIIPLRLRHCFLPNGQQADSGCWRKWCIWQLRGTTIRVPHNSAIKNIIFFWKGVLFVQYLEGANSVF